MLPTTLERAGVSVLVVLLAACTADTSDEPSDAEEEYADTAQCEADVDRLADGVQSYLDSLADVSVQEYLSQPDRAAVAELQELVEERRLALRNLDCDLVAVDRRLERGLDGLTGEGAVAEAVAGGLRDHLLTGTAVEPRRIEVSVDDDLAAHAVTAPAGSTLELEPGDHHLDEAVLVAQPLTIVGAGPDRTRIVSDAADAALLVLEFGALDLGRLTVTSEADSVTAAVVSNSSRYRFRDVHITGASSTTDAGGVGLLLQPTLVGPEPLEPPDIEGSDGVFDRTVEGLVVSDNAGGGLAVLGRARPSVDGAEARDNDGCGVCYLGSRGGSLIDSRLTGNDIGVVVSATASVTMRDLHVSDNATQGLLVDEEAEVTIDDAEVVDNGEQGAVLTGGATVELTGNRFEGNGQQGAVLTGEVTGQLTDNRFEGNGEVALALGESSDTRLRATQVQGHEIGIWVEGDATTTIEDQTSSGPGTVGIVVGGGSTGQITGTTVNAYEVGIEVREEASASLVDVLLADSEEAGLVLRDDASVEGSQLRCEDNAFDVALLDRTSSDLEVGDCEVHDQR